MLDALGAREAVDTVVGSGDVKQALRRAAVRRSGQSGTGAVPVNPVAAGPPPRGLAGADLPPAASALVACGLRLMPGELSPGLAGRGIARFREARAGRTGREAETTGTVLAEVHGPYPLADPHPEPPPLPPRLLSATRWRG